jgi:branched-chain amino acid transport system ATP-binding protein
LLEIENLHVCYGGIHALKGISLTVKRRQIVTLLGSNGSGKSTTIRAISGIVPIGDGQIRFEGTSLNKIPPHSIQRLGLVHVPEGRKIFRNLTVRENLMMGAYNVKDMHEVAQSVERVLSIFPPLKSRLGQLGGTLSGGEQQMLAVSRAMMSRPKVLMMDEPSLGLAPMVVAEVFRVIEEIQTEGVTIFVVEQNANAALKIADYAFLLETGRVVLQGSGAELLDNPRVRETYLGERN